MNFIKTNLIIISLTFLFVNFAFALQLCDSNTNPSTPDNRFVINDGAELGTVTDLNTGLMWTRCLWGLSGRDCEQGSEFNDRWKHAKLQAKSVQFAGYNDWRIPTQNELAAIVEVRCIKPALNTQIFPNNKSRFVWSNERVITLSNRVVLGVDFYNGNKTSESEYDDHNMLLVRGGY